MTYICDFCEEEFDYVGDIYDHLRDHIEEIFEESHIDFYHED